MLLHASSPSRLPMKLPTSDPPRYQFDLVEKSEQPDRPAPPSLPSGGARPTTESIPLTEGWSVARTGPGLSGDGFQFSQDARRPTAPVAPVRPDSTAEHHARRTKDITNPPEAPAPEGDSDDSPVEAPLAHLVERERVISRERQVLHRRIEFARGTAAHEPAAQELVARLVAEERELSAKRRALHETIDRRNGSRQ
jgi:hypothetical protein